MEAPFELNEITKKLPKHLHAFIVKQPYADYTAQNQAVWRYVMRMNVDYLKDVAHESYLDGLKQTGVSIECIAHMQGMNRILKEIGWAAVSVDGFIPPNAFMEFQAYNVLVVASEMRTIDHIAYTPAPDIIHEAAGHAPIIANPEYAAYLRRFGEIGAKAISSEKDYQMYEAIRLLSILKEDPNATQQQIKKAQQQVHTLQQNMGELSEMAQIRNLHWWTVEYGLIGTLENPKIYGAGLLSSIGESKWCMQESVKKIPYSIAAAMQNFDITKPQPQLFVTPDFAYLSLVLEEFANTMALRTGGVKGVKKLIDSKNLGTIELSTGLQISGVFSNIITDTNADAAYIQTNTATALSLKDKELIGHAPCYHAQGFGSPIGRLKGINIPIECMSPRDLQAYGIYEGKMAHLTFESGVTVQGRVITGTRDLKGKIILISFDQCTVTYKDQVLFDPSWGTYDMVVAEKIVSAYAGAADPNSFTNTIKVSDTKTSKIKYSASDIALHQLYTQVRTARQNNTATQQQLQDILTLLQDQYPTDWLLPLELYELALSHNYPVKTPIKQYLEDLQANTAIKPLIASGLALLA